MVIKVDLKPDDVGVPAFFLRAVERVLLGIKVN